MARYIDADALQAQLERKKTGIANQRYTEGWNDCMMRVKSMVSTTPIADVAPVLHGKWVFGGDGCVICSECNEEESNDNHRKYCPNCGAKMYWKR